MKDLKKTIKKVKRIKKDITTNYTYLIIIALKTNTSISAAKQSLSKGKTWMTSLADKNGIKHNYHDKLSISALISSNLYILFS